MPIIILSLHLRKNTTIYQSMSQKARAFLKNTLKAVIPLAIGVLIFVWVYREINFENIWSILKKGVHYQWIIFSLLFCFLGEVIRGVRWGLLITPLGRKAKTSNLIYSVFVNYLVNLILLRMGEVARCAVINKYEKVSFTKAIGTLITERIVDLLSLAVVILLAFLPQMNNVFNFLNQETSLVDNVSEIFTSVWLYVGLAVVVILIWIVWTQFEEAVFIRKFKQATQNVWSGVKTIRQLEAKTTFGIMTVLLWVVYFLQFYVCIYAFDFSASLTIFQGLFIFVMANIGIVVPVQGGIGPWHFMVIHTMVFFGIGSIEAAAFALIVHGAQMIFTILIGVFGVVALPLTNKKIKKNQ